MRSALRESSRATSPAGRSVAPHPSLRHNLLRVFCLPEGGPVTSITQSVSRHPRRSLAIAGGGALAAYLTAVLAVLWQRRS